ncbi:hypothetical protein KKA39_01290 [Patescibacteria group bacterium]|nr:hypothetical protein [Patescibacteria group bacterium]MBU1727926.1 hypothetical protein [Patescibacteria group bacterium]
MKKNIITIFIILLVVLGYFVWQNYRNKNVIFDDSVFNENIPEGFLYTNFSDKIPDSFYIDWREVESTFVSSPSDGRICKKTGEKAQIINYFKEKLGDCEEGIYGCGGSYERQAIVCGNQYVISDISLSGFPYWGPFDIKE